MQSFSEGMCKEKNSGINKQYGAILKKDIKAALIKKGQIYKGNI